METEFSNYIDNFTPKTMYYTEDEFNKIIASALEKEKVKFLQEDEENHSWWFRVWIDGKNIDVYRIPAEYLDKLKETFIKNGWRDAEIKIQNDRGYKLYIGLYFPATTEIE